MPCAIVLADFIQVHPQFLSCAGQTNKHTDRQHYRETVRIALIRPLSGIKGPELELGRLLIFSTVCLELAATNSSHQWFSVCFFKSRLKTVLFNQAFTEHWSDLPPAPRKLRPYGAIEIRVLLALLLLLLLLLLLFNELIKVAQCQNDCWNTLQKKERKDVRAAQRRKRVPLLRSCCWSSVRTIMST